MAGDLGVVHDIEIFVDPTATDTPDLIAEGPVDTVAALGDYTYATNTYYCKGRDDANTVDVPLEVAAGAAPAMVGIHLLDVGHVILATGTSAAPMAADAVAGTGPSIGDVGWDWTFDKVRGLQVCVNHGASWDGIADDIEVWVGGVSKGTIAAAAANAISCSAISGVGPSTDPAPTAVALGVRDAADNTIGVLPAPVSQALLTPSDTGWDHQLSGNALGVRVVLGTSLPAATHFIEVYPNPPIAGQENEPALIHNLPGGGALPTDLILDLDVIDLTDPLATVNPLKVAFLDAGGNLITFNSGAGINIQEGGPLKPPPPPPPAPEPTPTPVQTTEIPASQVTPVAAPTGGISAIIQPSAAAMVSAPDGSVSVAIPALANAITFQLQYNPSPASVPMPPAKMNIVRAFELNAYDTGGAQMSSLTLLRTVTITVAYTPADVAVAPQKNPANLKIARYDTANQAWTSLNTTLDLAAQTLSAKVSRFSLFAVVGVEPPPQVAPISTPKAPATGDFAPGSGLVLALILAGFLLITAGGAYLTQSRSARN